MAKRDGKSKHINYSNLFKGVAGAGLLGALLGKKIRKVQLASATKDLGNKVVPIKSIKRVMDSRPKTSTLAEEMSKRNDKVLRAYGKKPRPKAKPKAGPKGPSSVIDFESAKKRLEKRGSFWDGFMKAMEDDFYE